MDIGFKIEPRTHRLIMMGALDNLVKGAAGQAVQNMNLLFGLPETEGLWQHRCSRRSVNKIPLQGKRLNVLLDFGLFPCNGIRLQYLQNEEKCENP